MNVKRNFECPATGTACEKKTCKRGFCQIEEREWQVWQRQEREEQERLERAKQHPALAAIVERLIEKLKRTNPGCFRQPRR
jgi:hypothetical protein